MSDPIHHDLWTVHLTRSTTILCEHGWHDSHISDSATCPMCLSTEERKHVSMTRTQEWVLDRPPVAFDLIDKDGKRIQ